MLRMVSVIIFVIIFAPYRVTKRRGLWSFTIDYMKARVILFEMSRRAKSGPRISRKYPAAAESQARVKQRRCQNRLWQGLNPKGNEKKISHLSWLGLEIAVVSSRITSARRRETLQKIIRMDGMSKSREEIALFADDSQIDNFWLKRCRPNPYQPKIYCSVNLRRMPLILLPTASLRLNYLPLLSEYFVL